MYIKYQGKNAKIKSIFTSDFKQICSTQITQPLPCLAWNDLPSVLFLLGCP